MNLQIFYGKFTEHFCCHAVSHMYVVSFSALSHTTEIRNSSYLSSLCSYFYIFHWTSKPLIHHIHLACNKEHNISFLSSASEYLCYRYLRFHQLILFSFLPHTLTFQIARTAIFNVFYICFSCSLCPASLFLNSEALLILLINPFCLMFLSIFQDQRNVLKLKSTILRWKGKTGR